MKEEKRIFRDWEKKKYQIYYYQEKNEEKIPLEKLEKDERFIELWNPMTGEYLEGFYISNYGTVIKATGIKTNPRMTAVKQETTAKGYKRVRPQIDGKRQNIMVHRAVYYSFAMENIKKAGIQKVFAEEDINTKAKLKKIALMETKTEEELDSKEGLKKASHFNKVYVVHHLDLDTKNNNTKNLVLYKKKTHDALHELQDELLKIQKTITDDEAYKRIAECLTVSKRILADSPHVVRIKGINEECSDNQLSVSGISITEEQQKKLEQAMSEMMGIIIEYSE